MLLLFGGLSLAAVATGAAICAASGVPAALWVRNLVAWLVGALAAVAIARTARPGVLLVVLWAAPLALLATFLNPGQLGVHRWAALGPLSVNVAMLVTPAAVVALAGLASRRRWPWVAALLSLGLLCAQPDASQATALTTAVILIAAMTVREAAVRWSVIGATVALVALAWTRPDPLMPVPEVEDVVGLAFAWSPLAGVAASLLLVATAIAPAISVRSSPATRRTAGGALSLCLVGWAAMPLIGAFPVPFVGIGLSPILGAWLGVGLLAGVLRD